MEEPKKTIRIVINGQQYNSLDEVPAELRALFEKNLQEGLAQAQEHPGQNVRIQKSFKFTTKLSQGPGAIGPGSFLPFPFNLFALGIGAAALLYVFVKMYL